MNQSRIAKATSHKRKAITSHSFCDRFVTEGCRSLQILSNEWHTDQDQMPFTVSSSIFSISSWIHSYDCAPDLAAKVPCGSSNPEEKCYCEGDIFLTCECLVSPVPRWLLCHGEIHAAGSHHSDRWTPATAGTSDRATECVSKWTTWRWLMHRHWKMLRPNWTISTRSHWKMVFAVFSCCWNFYCRFLQLT